MADGDTAVDRIAAGVAPPLAVDAGVVAPQFLTAGGVECVDPSQLPEVYMTPSTTTGVASRPRLVPSGCCQAKPSLSTVESLMSCSGE
jgi:hypothetical protein